MCHVLSLTRLEMQYEIKKMGIINNLENGRTLKLSEEFSRERNKLDQK